MAQARRNDGWSKAGKELLAKLQRLRVDATGGVRRPHKPLLLLLALQKLLFEQEQQVAFAEIEGPMLRLLSAYAPPAKAPDPALPYWHLQSDGVWEVLGVSPRESRTTRRLRRAELRGTVASLPMRFCNALLASESLGGAAVRTLLDEHFAPSLHDDVLRDCGFPSGYLHALPLAPAVRQRSELVRDRAFREQVLAAYGHRCAATGFAARLEGSLICLEAAHVHWHSQGGPSVVQNGIPLSPTMHKLFDHGAWSIDDALRIVVSRRFTGSAEGIEALQPLHGRPLLKPVVEGNRLDLAFVRWHREPRLGGVFRAPALGEPA